MLQQTPGARVQPVWREWLERWPTPARLAAAPTSDLLRAWARRGEPSRPQARSRSDVGAAARCAGVGHRSSHSRHTGCTRATGVCWSITSLTSTPQGVRSAARHGRSRAWPAYQARTGRTSGCTVRSCLMARSARLDRHAARLPGEGAGSTYRWERKESPMSTVLRPAGPEPAQVYWTRRFLVLAGLILVVVLIWSVLSGLGGGNGDAEGTTQDGAAADGVTQETPATDAPAARTCAAAYVCASLVTTRVRSAAAQVRAAADLT